MSTDLEFSFPCCDIVSIYIHLFCQFLKRRLEASKWRFLGDKVYSFVVFFPIRKCPKVSYAN